MMAWVIRRIRKLSCFRIRLRLVWQLVFVRMPKLRYVREFMEGEDEIYESIDEYLKSLKPLPSPYLQNGKLSAKAKRGKKIFEENCASCHSGQYYTDLKQYKVDWTTGPDKGLSMDVPALNECWRTAPYLYDGRSYSMKDMLKVHGPHKPVSEKELEELEEYVLSL